MSFEIRIVKPVRKAELKEILSEVSANIEVGVDAGVIWDLDRTAIGCWIQWTPTTIAREAGVREADASEAA